MVKPNEQEGVAALAPGTVVDGRYRVVGFIGQGGSGAVYEVEHMLTGRRLALKCLLDEASYGRLEQEARAASLMKNEHSVKITDMGRSGPGGPYLVMELLEGQSLRGLLEETGQLPLSLTVNIALQVCECLAEAHARGIIHRDLKPENIFLCADATPGQYDVKVLDFGVVKIASDGPIPASSLTRTGSTVGTPYYMSLEQLRNSSNVDARADIYALGVVLYESLSGTKPYQAETLGDLVYALAVGPPPPLVRIRPDLPAPLCDAVMRTLSSNREKRPSTMTELAEQLLPHADPARGLWLKNAPRGPAPQASRPGSGEVPVRLAPRPSGATGAKMSLTAPFPTSVDRDREQLEEEDDEHAGDSDADPPTQARRGNRDTPTEMYRKAVHDVAAPITDVDATPDAETGRHDTPTQAFNPSRASSLPEPAGTDADHTSRLPSMPSEQEMQAPTHPLMSPPGFSFMATQPAERPDLESLARTAQAQGYPNPIHGSVAPPPTPPPPMAFAPTMQAGSIPQSLPQLPAQRAKPGWQVSLDRTLKSVGDFLENTVTRTGRGFRNASPKAQIGIVMGGASICAALLILILYLIVR